MAQCLQNYQILTTLLQSGRETLQRVSRKQDGKLLILKSIACPDVDAIATAVKDISKYSQLDSTHPFMLRCVEWFLTQTKVKRQDQTSVCALLESYDGNSLREVIQQAAKVSTVSDDDNKLPTSFSEASILSIVISVLDVIQKISVSGCECLSISPDTIFLTRDNTVKMGGIAYQNSETACDYLAPEVVDMLTSRTPVLVHSKATAVYALGMLALDLASMKLASQRRLEAAAKAISPADAIPKCYSESFRSLLSGMIRADVNYRLTPELAAYEAMNCMLRASLQASSYQILDVETLKSLHKSVSESSSSTVDANLKDVKQIHPSLVVETVTDKSASVALSRPPPCPSPSSRTQSKYHSMRSVASGVRHEDYASVSSTADGKLIINACAREHDSQQKPAIEHKEQREVANDKRQTTQKAVQPDLTSVDHFHLGNMMFREGKLDDAINHYAEAIRLDPRHTNAFVNLGNCLKDKGMLDQAIQYYEQVLQVDPNHVLAHINFGNAMQAKGNLDQAVVHYRAALKVRSHVLAHFNLAVVLECKGRLDEAMTEYRAALRLDPQLAPAHLGLGGVLLVKRNFDAAIVAYQEAIRLNPHDFSAFNNLGIAFAEKGDLTNAQMAYQEAVNLCPTDPNLHCSLAIVYHRAGQLREAAEEYHQTLSYDPNHSVAQKNLSILQGRVISVQPVTVRR
eukprot:GILJ01013226.1.p1 GENE.GILJ01013226.1~~GILJ01013226.1.p1  ORF type:complete len:700 (-),score=91.85 GILJ01013226.1:133-2187(-)